MIARRLYVVMGGMLLVQAIPAVCADKKQEDQQAELKQQATVVAATTQLQIQPSLQSPETSPASSNNSTPASSPELNQRPKAEFPKQEQPKQERPKSGSGGGILNWEMQQEARRKENGNSAFTLKSVGIHHAIGAIAFNGTGLFKKLVNHRSFTMVNVSNDRNIAYMRTLLFIHINFSFL